MRKHEAPQVDPTLPVELTLDWPGQTKPFVITGDYESVAPIAAAVQAGDIETVKHAPKLVKSIAEPPVASQDVLPIYQPATTKSKVRDWLSDRQWAKVDRELGLTGTEQSIVLQRREQRLAQRILVARMAAGVDKLPVWTKNRQALKIAELALAD